MTASDAIFLAMKRKHITKRALAMQLGMHEKTFANKLANDTFTRPELLLLIQCLEMDDPIAAIFPELQRG